MKYVAFTFLVSALTLGPRLEAQTHCPAQTCQALIMPIAQAAHLPLEGWLYPVGQTQTVTVVEAPRFGTWNAAQETYSPTATFRSAGIDRMVLQLAGEPGPRTVVFSAAQPQVIGTSRNVAVRALNPGEIETLGGPEDPNTGGTSGIGGGVAVNPNPPGGGGTLPAEGFRSTLFTLGTFARIDMVMPPATSYIYYEAVVTNSALGCSNCVLPLDRNPGEHFLSLELGPDVWALPGVDRFRLTFKVLQNGVLLRQATLGGLHSVDLGGAFDVQAGLIGGDPMPLQPQISYLTASRLIPGGDDLLAVASAENFPDGARASYWGQQGTVTTTQTSAADWMAEIDLEGMGPSSKSLLLDGRPAGAERFRALFDLDLTDLDLADNDSLVMLTGQGNYLNGTGKSFDLFLRKQNGSLWLRSRMITAAGVTVSGPLVPLSSGKNSVAVHFGAGSGTGTLTLVIGSAVVSVQTGVDNAGRVVESANIGVASPALAASTKVQQLRFDNVTALAKH